MSSPRRALIAGLDPALLQESGPGITAPVVRDAMQEAVTSLRRDGIHAELCLLPASGPEAVTALRAAVEATDWDVVLVGAGIRLAPERSWLLEDLVEVVARRRPRPRLAFNGGPQDMAAAVRRTITRP